MEQSDWADRAEPPVWEGRPAWSHYFFLWFIVAVLAIRGLFSLRTEEWGSAAVDLAGTAMLAALGLFLRRTTRYRVTRLAISRSDGLFGNAERTFQLSSIASVREHRGPFDRLLGCGDVMLHLNDGTQERLAGVNEPEVVCRKIEALL
jgi:membrane protein YdbS with pleckstrin-like domain